LQHDANAVASFQEAKTLWAMGKSAGKTSLTNFFLSQRAVERAISKGKFFGIAKPGGSILYRQDRDFFHVYAHYSKSEVFNSVLNEIPTNAPLVADIIQRGDSHQEFAALLSDSGFARYRMLDRLNRPQQGLPEQHKKVAIENATLGDAGKILGDLEAFFDKFSEQLPELDEIEEAVTNDCIIVSRINGELAGFLFYEKSGRKSVIRYWFVNPQFRNMNVGSSLIRHYLSISCPDTSSQLWVVTDNYDALNKYKYYGYEKDVLNDLILMRK
jgi:hypothetical protein